MICKYCATEIPERYDHGKPVLFCNRECFLKSCNRPIPKQCETCGTDFVAKYRRRDGVDGYYQRYCSKSCYGKAKENRVTRECISCGESYTLRVSNAAQQGESGCCSIGCRKKYYKGTQHKNWKGGKYLSESSGNIKVRWEREGYVGNYPSEHRKIASEIIGRVLDPREKILHLNGRRADNNPENLFVCESVSECSMYIQGSIDWPLKSNLQSYR